MSKPVIAIVEWNSDSGAEPGVWLADSAEQACAAAARYLWPLIESINYIDAQWIEQNPEPDYDDAESVKKWLYELKEATTDAWLSIYEPAEPGQGVSCGNYEDLRI